MSIKCIVFDFDYTLGDSTIGIVESVNYGLTQLGYPKACDIDIRYTVGLSLFETYKVLSGDDDIRKSNQFCNYFKEKADEVMAKETTLFSDVVDTLTALHARGISTGIVTTKYHYRIDEILASNQISGLIDFVVGSDDVSVPKPDPEGLLKMIDHFGLKNHEVFYVGDSLVDAKTAMSANVDFIAVTTGMTKKEQFFQYPLVDMIEKLDQLLQIID